MNRDRLSLSIRAAAVQYGLSREVIRRHLDEIPHRWIGSRTVFLRSDFESWLRGDGVRPTAHAEDVVAARLQREQQLERNP